MRTLVLLALVGLGAQLVDGSLGMAYGVTSTTLLLAVGTNPAAASATVHLAEIGTTLVSGASHWRFGNVDWKVVAKIGIPGAVGAFAGATFLSGLSTETAAPLMSLVLLTLGLYILVRFTTFGLPKGNLGKPLRKRFLTPLGIVAGFVDATGGGGWGPVGTPALLASGRLEPRKTIGSIDTSEFLVAVAASIGFFVGIGSENIDVTWVLALLIGGVIAAPIAAWLVRHIPPRVLGSAVGGLIVLTNTRTLLRSDWIDASDGVRHLFYAAIYLVWAAALAHAARRHLATRDGDTSDRPVAVPPEVPLLPTGAVSSFGSTGSTGSTGPIDSTGLVGSTGPIGLVGPAGPVGPVGPVASTASSASAVPRGAVAPADGESSHPT